MRQYAGVAERQTRWIQNPFWVTPKYGFDPRGPHLVLKRLTKKECEVIEMTPIEKKAKMVRLEGRISLLEKKGAQNTNIVKALKRDLRNLQNKA